MTREEIINNCLQSCADWGLIPTEFKQCMTWEEQVLWLQKFLTETVIPAFNENTAAYKDLKAYVENFFANLDVQEEIDNKLEEMFEDGTLTAVLGLTFPAITGESGVVNALLPYGDVRRYGAACDGETDDTDAVNYAIACAQIMNIPVRLHGKIYVSETINTHGVKMIGDKQPYASGAYYPNGIGYDYPKNVNDGASITFADYIETIPDGTCIVSDTASPILSTDYDKGFKLEKFGVYGWLRNTTQIGVEVNTDLEATYYNGHHEFNNFSVFNTGSYGIHLHSIETTTLDNLRVELTNSYGIYIEGLGSGIDTPSDYTTFKDCRIRHTRLAGIKFYNTMRKNIKFEHCNFNYIGQYDFGVCNDTYGERALPVDNDYIIYAIEIDGLDPVGGYNMRYLQAVNNYGEKTLGFIKTRNIETIAEYVDQCNAMTKGFTTSVACYLNTDVQYFTNTDIDYQTTDFNTIYRFTNLKEISTYRFITNQLKAVIADSVLFKESGKTGYKAFKTISGDTIFSKDNVIDYTNFYHYGSSSSSEQSVVADLGARLDVFLQRNQPTSSGQSYAIGLLSLSAAGNTSSPAVADLVAITRHNDKRLVTFLTHNLTASADTDGKVTVTVPAYKILTFQWLQEVYREAAS